MPVCKLSLSPGFLPIPYTQQAGSLNDTEVAGTAALAPRQAPLSGVCFSHQLLVNEARVTDHWLDNEFILQTHREQGSFLAHLFAELLTAWLRERCFRREQQTPGRPLMCNRPRFDGPCNVQCKAFSAKKWKETEHWDCFRAIAGNS